MGIMSNKNCEEITQGERKNKSHGRRVESVTYHAEGQGAGVRVLHGLLRHATCRETSARVSFNVEAQGCPRVMVSGQVRATVVSGE